MITFIEQEKDGMGTVNGLDGARGLAASSDGANLYATGERDGAVVTFQIVF